MSRSTLALARPATQRVLAAIAVSILVAACSGGGTTPAPSQTASALASVAASADSSPTATPTPGPTTFAPATSLTLKFDDNAQTEIIGDTGRRIFIDVYLDDDLPKPAPGPNDILLTSHRHDDHYLPDFVNAFPGPTLTDKPGTLKFDDVTITSLDASHTNDLAETLGSDHIFVIEMAGLRIVHFGDCGQTKLTPEQEAAIIPGKVDVAISQTYNVLSLMDASNEKGVNLMKQVAPKLFIPTHHDVDTITYAASLWPSFYETKKLTLKPSVIPDKTTMLYMNVDADYFSAVLNLPEGKW